MSTSVEFSAGQSLNSIIDFKMTFILLSIVLIGIVYFVQIIYLHVMSENVTHISCKEAIAWFNDFTQFFLIVF